MDIENSVIAYLDLDRDRSDTGEDSLFPPPPKLIELKETHVTFGRASDNVAIWESLKISRRHAVMSYENQIWKIKDTSSNGMMVNGCKLPPKVYVDLHHLDTIAFVPTGWPQYTFHQVIPSESRLSHSTSALQSSVVAIPAAAPLRAFPTSSSGDSAQILADKKGNELDLEPIHGESSSQVKDLLQLYEDRIAELETLASGQRRAGSEMDGVLTDLRSKVFVAQKVTHLFQEGLTWTIVKGVETEFSCSICSGIFIQATVIDCGHTFCAHCISEWVKRKSECPRCQKPVRIQVKHTDVENFITKFHGMLPEEMQKWREEMIQDRAKEVAASARGLRSRGIRSRAPLSQWQQRR